MGIKSKFHKIVCYGHTVYFSELSFESKSKFAEAPTLDSSIYRRKIDKDSGEIVIKGKVDDENSEEVKKLISTFSTGSKTFVLDGETYESRTLSSAFCSFSRGSILGDFEIRLVKSND